MAHNKQTPCRQEPGIFMPVVNPGRCEGKAECVSVCPEDVFEIRRIADHDYQNLGLLAQIKQRLHGMRVAYAVNPDACRACGQCVTTCPEKAVSLKRIINDTRTDI